jgi:ABC-type sugar transport system, permease component
MAATATLETRPETATTGRAAQTERHAKLFNRVCFGVLIAFAIIWLIPILWALDTALKPNAETVQLPTTWVIHNPTLDSFKSILKQGDIWHWYAASFITSAITVVGTVFTGSLSPSRSRGFGSSTAA